MGELQSDTRAKVYKGAYRTCERAEHVRQNFGRETAQRIRATHAVPCPPRHWLELVPVADASLVASSAAARARAGMGAVQRRLDALSSTSFPRSEPGRYTKHATVQYLRRGSLLSSSNLHPPPLAALLSRFLRRLTPLSPAVHSLCYPRRRHTMAAPKTLPECWGHRGVSVCMSQSNWSRRADCLHGRCCACEGLSCVPGKHACQFRARLSRWCRGDREW